MKGNLWMRIVTGLIFTFVFSVSTVKAIPLQEAEDNAVFPPEDALGNVVSSQRIVLEKSFNNNQNVQENTFSAVAEPLDQKPLKILNIESNSIDDDSIEEENFIEGGPNMFTVTNTDVGFTWEKLPYREKYQWDNENAPCHKFNLQIPDEKSGQSGITLCIYRPHLEFMDDTELFIHHVEAPDTIQEQKELKVYGYVKGENGSVVYGKITNTYFYGEVSIFDQEEQRDVIYVVEEIKILTKLMRYNEKILRNILYVMNDGSAPSAKKYNAVVTKGASLMSFMTVVNPSEFVRGSFIVFSTRHNSYITAGEPRMEISDNGKVTLNAGGDQIQIDTEGQGAVRLKFRNNRDYIFRPGGKTVVHEGTLVTVVREHEGPVAVSAFTSDSSYGCILPTPAFTINRKGGYLCKVCLAADKLFLKHYVASLGHHETAVSVLGKMIDRVSWMFRSVDWNNDKHPDNVGLDYDPQFDTWKYTESGVGEENITDEELDVLFGSLSNMDFSDCCIGVTYTMKAFPGTLYAKSSVAEKSSQGGVCAARADGVYSNLILISANNKEGGFSTITEDQLTYLTANQIAKAFGAGSDGEGKDVCDQFIDQDQEPRHYLMWPDVLRNISIEEKVPSSCTKESVAQTLSTCKTACFDIDKHPFCGNGIVEEGEECDCGNEYSCTLQKCCYSRTGRHPCMKTGIACKVPSKASSLSATFTNLLNAFQFVLLSIVVDLLFLDFSAFIGIRQ